MSTGQTERRELWIVYSLALLLAVRAADTATTLPVLLARPSAELNPAVHVIVDVVGIAGYTGLSLAAAPLIVLVVEGLLLIDDSYVDGDDVVPDDVFRVFAYGSTLLVCLAVVANNVVQLAEVIP